MGQLRVIALIHIGQNFQLDLYAAGSTAKMLEDGLKRLFALAGLRRLPHQLAAAVHIRHHPQNILACVFFRFRRGPGLRGFLLDFGHGLGLAALLPRALARGQGQAEQ